ncbi:MAG: hypothetical protein KR126chlam3_00526 [Chlamydiae bacterium]|nr:hypothetical protein [Chlamydiota bacterium]
MWIAYCLSIIGLILIYLEFFLPGGIIALLGGLLLVGGVTYFSTFEVAVGYKVLYFALTILMTGATCKLALRVLSTRKNDQFYLNADQEGFVAGSFDKTLVGREAKAASDLKPSGHIQLKEERFQAVSEGEYITKGSEIIISGGRGAYLIVKEKK